MRKAKSRARTAAAAVLLLALALLAGCEEARQTADMRITLEENARTLQPSSPDFEVSSYHIVARNSSGQSVADVNTTRSTFVLQGLPIGNYTIKASGLNSQRAEIVTGSTTFNLSHTNSTAVVKLNQLVGSGNINITFTWDSSLIKDPGVRVTLTPVDGSGEAVVDELTVSTASASYTKNDLASGSYTISAELFDDKTKVAGAVEAVRVSDKATVTGNIDFDLDALPDNVGQITIENGAGVPVVCTVSGIEANSTVAACVSREISLDVSGLESGDELDIAWYLDATKIGTGESVTISPDPGSHRLDVVASTSKLGSTGSTQINFDAALMGDKGVPVKANSIKNGSVEGLSFSSDMVVEYLPDGNALVIDNATNMAQVCEIRRNTLQVKSTLTLYNDAISAVTVPGRDKIAIAQDKTFETTIYNYNPSTYALSKWISNGGLGMSLGETDYNFTSIYGLARKWPSYDGDSLACYGVMSHDGQSAYTVTGVVGWALDNGDKFSTLSYNYLNMSYKGTWDLFGSNWVGDMVASANSSTGNLSFVHDLKGANYSGTVSSYATFAPASSYTAVSPLPGPAADKARMIAADGDTFRIFDVDLAGSMSSSITEATGEKITRTEGSGLSTTKLLLSRDESFLYAMNEGGNSISTYSVSGTGKVAFVAETELNFSPTGMALHPNGEYMIVWSDNGGEIAMMRIKTTD